MQSPVQLPRSPGWVSEFRAFIMRGNVVDLAVGIIIGAAFTSVVNSLVKDVFTPLLGLVAGGIDFKQSFCHPEGIARADARGGAESGGGHDQCRAVLNSCFSFLIVSFVIFWLVQTMNRFKKKQAEKPEALTKTEQTLLEIRDLLSAEPRKPVR